MSRVTAKGRGSSGFQRSDVVLAPVKNDDITSVIRAKWGQGQDNKVNNLDNPREN